MEDLENVAQNHHEGEDTNIFLTSKIKVVFLESKPENNSAECQIKNIQT